MMKSIEKKILNRAKLPAINALKLHPFYKGKIEIACKCCIRNFNDFAIWYSPGVAEPCKAIVENKDAVYENTNKWNTIAIVSDGTRVLGLGDVGPEASLPVMEGKSLLFKLLGGVDAYPICLNTKDPANIINVVKWIQPSFSGINLEDITTPKCFDILNILKKETDIPIWHDDQQGTATITVAGIINALKLVNKKINDVLVTFIGAGAANISTYRFLTTIGLKKKNIIFCDSKGILNMQRKDLEANKDINPYKWNLCVLTNEEQRGSGIKEAMKDADIVIAASKPGPGTIVSDDICVMADDAIVFSLANPTPEIWPWEAIEAGARIVATGRSDFPNQINNSLGFPGIFRGVLDVRASTITDEMCLQAAFELARFAEERGLNEECIVPKMNEWEIYPREAMAVGLKAIKQGIAGIKYTRKELFEKSSSIIKKARNETDMLMKKGFIALPPDEQYGKGI